MKVIKYLATIGLFVSVSAHAVVISCEQVKGSETFVIDTVNKKMFGVYGNVEVSIDEHAAAYIVTGGFDDKYPVTITISRVNGDAVAVKTIISKFQYNFRCKPGSDKPAF